MAESSRPRRPRSLGSRTPTGRPRRIAGQGAPAGPHPAEEETPAGPGKGTPESPGPPVPGDEEEPAEEAPRGRRRTTALVVAIVVLVLVGAGEILYLNHDDTPAPSAGRPVVVGDATRGEAVDTAARSTEEILSTTFQGYDDQVDQAAAKMTDTFAAQYRKTAESIKDRFVAQKTRLQVKAVGQSVVQASSEQVQSLLFLNQYVQKVENGQQKTDFAQYRALVTVVHTDQGWLVSNIDTK